MNSERFMAGAPAHIIFNFITSNIKITIIETSPVGPIGDVNIPYYFVMQLFFLKFEIKYFMYRFSIAG